MRIGEASELLSQAQSKTVLRLFKRYVQSSHGIFLTLDVPVSAESLCIAVLIRLLPAQVKLV